MKAVIYRYALWAAAIMIALGMLNWFLIARPMGYRASEIVGYLSIILALSTIFLAVRHYGMRYGGVTFRQGFRIGILITLIASVAMWVYSALYFIVFGDAFKAWVNDHYESTMTPAAYQAHLDQMTQMPAWVLHPVMQGFIMFLTVFFIGLIITLIAALVMKKDATQSGNGGGM